MVRRLTLKQTGTCFYKSHGGCFLYLATSKFLFCSLFESVLNFLKIEEYLAPEFSLFSFVLYNNSPSMAASGAES